MAPSRSASRRLRGRACVVAAAAAALLASLWAPARAQDASDRVLTGTLAKASRAGAVQVGFRNASVPFSYLGPRGQPIGYSLDICRQIVDEMSRVVGRELSIRWVPVTSDTRFAAVVEGRVDLECGSTTANAQREKTLAFSPTIFVAGTRLLVRRGSGIRSFRDLGGKTVVFTAGTTNERAMRGLIERFKIPMTLVAAADHDASYAMVESGRADAFATDDVLLAGLIATHDAGTRIEMVGEFLSYEPYGIMFRKDDPQLAQVVTDALRSMAASRELDHAYDKWFMQRLPSGPRLNLPMSAQLTQLLRVMGADAAAD